MSRAVIDQPGVRVVVIGLILSIIIGLALRSQISEKRVQGYINKSIDRLQTDFKVDYDLAKVTLSRWGLPLPALVVENIRLSPKSIQCQSSQIYVEELEVPISIRTLLGFSQSIPKIRIKNIELRLVDLDKCIGKSTRQEQENAQEQEKDSKPEHQSDVSTEQEKPVAEIKEANIKNIFAKQTRAELHEIYIEKLKIISSRKTDQPVLLRQLNIDLSYTENKLANIHLKSKLNALKDARSDVYFLNSDLTANFKYTNFSEIESVVNIKGKLLDGDVQGFIHGSSSSNRMTYELDLNHVSIKALHPIVSSIEKNKELALDKMPISISLNNQGVISFFEKPKVDSKIKKLNIMIDNGQLSSKEIELKFVGETFTLKPFEIEIYSLPLSWLKNIEQLKSKLDSFESLGVLSGKFEYKNQNLYKLYGKLKNIKAIFSNRGRRDLQNIDNVNLKVTRDFKDLKFEASEFIVNNHNVIGNFSALYNVNTFDVSAQLKLKGAMLNNHIWEQFTFVEQSPSIQVLWSYKKNKTEIHNLKLSADQIFLPGIKMTGLNIDLIQSLTDNNDSNHLSVIIKPATLVADESFLQNTYISKILNPNTGFKLNTVNSNKTLINISGNDWKNISFDATSTFLSDSTVKSDTLMNLKGTVKFHEGLKAHLSVIRKNAIFKYDISKSPDKDINIQALK